jgi:hypothetical protein
MKSLVLLFALITPACSHFTQSGRMDRAYARHMKEVRIAREQRRARLLREISKPPPSPPTRESPVTVSVTSGDQ